MIVAVTGHRPDKLGTATHSGYAVDNPLRAWVKAQLRRELIQLRPLYGISGMALGVDLDFAEVCIELKIPFIAAVPFIGQDQRWPTHSREHYWALLRHAHSIEIVSPGGYERWKMLARNQWMIDHCNVLLAIWNSSSGGTSGTVHYAHSVGRTVHTIDPRDFVQEATVETA